MDGALEILVTNDDGIDSPGLHAVTDALSSIGEVTVVAPAEDQSAVGRSISNEVSITEREEGFAVEGTPADCVVAGLGALCSAPDLVVAGCNKGANLGEYVLGRSGTVSAAVEAAFFGVPAIATSLYVPTGDLTFEDVELSTDDYDEAARVTRFLAEHALGAGVFETAEYLNVNVPLTDDAPLPIEVTRPSHVYEMDATRDGASVVLHDHLWDRMAEGDVPDPEGTDRRAVVEGRISVSALTAPHSTTDHHGLSTLVSSYPDSRRS